jgi:hypothetical protein
MPSCDALVFMVDSNDVDRLPEAREELQVCFAWRVNTDSSHARPMARLLDGAWLCLALQG